MATAKAAPEIAEAMLRNSSYCTLEIETLFGAETEAGPGKGGGWVQPQIPGGASTAAAKAAATASRRSKRQ